MGDVGPTLHSGPLGSPASSAIQTLREAFSLPDYFEGGPKAGGLEGLGSGVGASREAQQLEVLNLSATYHPRLVDPGFPTTYSWSPPSPFSTQESSDKTAIDPTNLPLPNTLDSNLPSIEVISSFLNNYHDGLNSATFDDLDFISMLENHEAPAPSYLSSTPNSSVSQQTPSSTDNNSNWMDRGFDGSFFSNPGAPNGFTLSPQSPDDILLSTTPDPVSSAVLSSGNPKVESDSTVSRGETQHPCRWCHDRWFDTRTKLKQHERYHEKPFICPHAGCDYWCSLKTDLDRHLETLKHRGQKTFKCPQCPRRLFTRADNLRRHVRKKH